MSARVYLFALMPGSEQPKVVARSPHHCSYYPGRKCTCAPWWLVECDSAARGRYVIERGGTEPVYAGPGPGLLMGRILASGGAA